MVNESNWVVICSSVDTPQNSPAEAPAFALSTSGGARGARRAPEQGFRRSQARNPPVRPRAGGGDTARLSAPPPQSGRGRALGSEPAGFAAHWPVRWAARELRSATTRRAETRRHGLPRRAARRPLRAPASVLIPGSAVTRSTAPLPPPAPRRQPRQPRNQRAVVEHREPLLGLQPGAGLVEACARR